MARSMDVGRMAKAVSMPGIDPRPWVQIGYVIEANVDDEGPFVDVKMEVNGRIIEETARVASVYAGPNYGLYFPLAKDDEVLVFAPGGNANAGLIALPRQWSKSDPPPAGAKSDPDNVHLHVKDGANITITVTGGGKINLGGDGATENFILGQQWKTFMTLVLTQIAAITVPTAVGTSGIPLNAANFTNEIQQLDAKLSDIIFGKKSS